MAAVSVGLYAKATDTGFTENGTSFEEDNLGPLVVTTEPGSYWKKDANEGDSYEVKALEDGTTYPSRPAMWADATNGKALFIDTSAPLLRNANAIANDNTFPAQPVTTPVFFDSVVQFTATDVAPSMENNTTDKLAVWLYATPEGTEGRLFGEDDAITNLVITAGYYDGDGNRWYTNYLTNVAIQPDTWHRLTIKAINDIGIHILPTPGFEVYVDGNNSPVSGKCDYDGENPTLVTKFPSLIARDNSGVNYLQGVAFDGKGAVDDIVFTTTAPEFTKEPEAQKFVVTLNYESSDKWTFRDFLIGGEPVTASNGGTYEIPIGTEFSILLSVESEYTLSIQEDIELLIPTIDSRGRHVLTFTPTAVGTGTITITAVSAGGGSGSEDPAKPTIGGAAVETAEAFIAAANSGATIKVPTDWTLDGNTLKYADGKEYATFANYYTATLATDGTVTLELNDNAEPTIDETAADKGDAIVVTDAAVALGVTNAEAGLWYGAQAYSDAACTTKIGDVTGWEQAKGTTVTVIATKPEGDKAFFKVVVDDQDHSSAEQK